MVSATAMTKCQLVRWQIFVYLDVCGGFCGCDSEKGRGGSTTSSQQSQSPEQGMWGLAVGDIFRQFLDRSVLRYSAFNSSVQPHYI